MASSLTRKLPTIVGALLLAATLFTAYTATQATAGHTPANKTAVAGSTVDVIGEAEGPVSIMQEQLRVSSPADLKLYVQLECSLVTDVKTVGDDDQSAEAQFDVWVTIDNKPVPVAATVPTGEGADDGRVTFCNRRYQRVVSNLNNGAADDDSDDDLTIETFFSTKSTHGFNWIALNVGRDGYDANGDNILDIQVWADYTEAETSKATASAVIGKRTLIIEPDKFAVHEAVLERPGVGN